MTKEQIQAEADKYADSNDIDSYHAFIKGAEWMQEQMLLSFIDAPIEPLKSQQGDEMEGNDEAPFNKISSNLLLSAVNLDQMVEHLRQKYMFSSSGDAKCIYHLIEFYDKHKGEQS